MSEPGPIDEVLMQAVGRGDLHAFDQIVLRHQSAAWSVAYRFLGDYAAPTAISLRLTVPM